MRTVIAGGRNLKDYKLVIKAVDRCGWLPTIVLSGAAKGADKLGEKWARANDIPVELYPADWNKHGISAGVKRNVLMASRAEALIALWDGKSSGTKHMIRECHKRGLKISVLLFKSNTLVV